jgi:hypothetical protein
MKIFEIKKYARTKPEPDKSMSTLLGGLSASRTRPSESQGKMSLSLARIELSVLSLLFKIMFRMK